MKNPSVWLSRRTSRELVCGGRRRKEEGGRREEEGGRREEEEGKRRKEAEGKSFYSILPHQYEKSLRMAVQGEY
jgi:hypothetical protein